MGSLLDNEIISKTISDQNRPPVYPITLSFKSHELNKAFEKSITKGSITFVRVSLLLAIALYAIFAWLDRLVTPEVVTELMIIRVLSCSMFIGAIYLTYTEWGLKNFQFMISMVVMLAGLGIIGMILVSESIGGYHYYAGLILAIMFAHGLLRIRFIYASLTTWFIIWTYITATIWLETTPFQIYVNNIFFLVSANVMGMFASYWLEYYMKAVFWNEHILNEKSEELRKESIRKSTELEAARIMQLNMLPQIFPYCPNYQFSFSMKAASEVGGDYYDYHRTPDEVLTFGIGDATGHGLQASVIVTAIKLLFSEYAVKTDLVEFLKRASHSISLMDFRTLYMAFAIGRLTENTLELAGAGMPPALIYRYKTKTVEQIPLKGLPLGSKTDFPYSKVTIEIEPGDVILFMTDGLPELLNPDGEMIGYSQIARIFQEVAHLEPESIVKHLHDISDGWLDGQSQNDDMTLFIFKRRLHADQVSTTEIPLTNQQVSQRHDEVPSH